MIKIDKKTEKNFLIAEELRSNDKSEQAIEILKEILHKYPGFPPALNSIALSYVGLKKFEEAESYFIKCMEIEPVPLVCINNFAKLYYNLNYFKKAIPLLRKSLKISTNQIQIIEITAVCLFEAGFKNEADNFYREVLKKFPNNNTIKYLQGKNLLRMNKHKEGLGSIKENAGVIEFGEKQFKID